MATKQEPQVNKKRRLTAVKAKHRVVLTKLVENGGNLSKAIKDSGLYSPSVSNDTTKITHSKSWNELIEEELPDGLLSGIHLNLLKSTRLDHMVFPLGPVQSKDKVEGKDELSDQDIVEMLSEVNCTVRRIVHGETARHVYFWASDNKSRKEALDMAYKLKGRYGNEGITPPRGNTYNFIFSAEVQQKIKGVEDDIKKMLTLPHAPTN